MLVAKMSMKEMYDNFLADEEKIFFRKEYLKSRAIKELKKKNIFPAYVWYDYKIPSTQNKYIIFFCAKNRNYIEKPIIGSFCEFYNDKKRFILKYGVSDYKHSENSKLIRLPQIHAYSSHFFQRYRERCLNDETLSANEVACRYFSRNTFSIPVQITNDINKNAEKYGDIGKVGFVVYDGFCFTSSGLEGISFENRDNDIVDAMLCIYTTFISKKEMDEKQFEAIKVTQDVALSYFKGLSKI